MVKNLKILHLNINGARHKLDLLQIHINEIDPHILLLNETKLDSHIPLKIDNFKIHRKDDTSRRGGVAIGINNNILANINEIDNSQVQALKAIIPIQNYSHPIQIICYYNPPNCRIDENIFNDCKPNTIIIGDLNAPHTYFGSNRTSTNGNKLRRLLDEHSLTLLNSNTHTRRNPVDDKPELLDLVICTQDLNNKHIATYSIEDPVISDHFLICTTFSLNYTKSLPEKPFRNPNNCNWENFKDNVHSSTNDLLDQVNSKKHDDESLDNLSVKISDIITASFNKNCPPSTKTKGKWEMTRNIMNLIKLKRKLRRDYLKNHNHHIKRQINTLKYQIKKEIKLQIIRNWDKTCKKINNETNSRKLWKSIAKITNPCSQSQRAYSNLVAENGEEVTNPQNQANLFAAYYSKVFDTPSHKKFDNKFKVEADSFIKENINLFTPDYSSKESDHPLTNNVSVDEVSNTLKHLPNHSAPGLDNVTYRMIKHCPHSFIEVLAIFFSLLISYGYFPKPWKSSRTIVIPKPKKSHTKPENYRPISLLSCVGKLFEKIIANRLKEHLENQHFFSDNQCGFRDGKSTLNHLFNISQHIQTSFRNQKQTSAIFLDAEKAFDQTWHNGLKYKLYNIGLPNNTLRILSSFLNNRELIISHRGTNSEKIRLKAGTPQGSVLSPLLYIIYVNDLPTCPEYGCNIAQFADDIAIWKSSTSHKVNNTYLQKTLNEIENWCCKWRIKINPVKSNHVTFKCRSRSNVPPPLTLKLFDQVIPPVKEAKFLGIILDENFTLTSHINEILKTAWWKLKCLQNLFLNRNTSSDNNIRIYNTLLRPIFEYGSFAFLATTKTNLSKLENMHVKALRWAQKIPSHISKDLVLDAANSPSLIERLIDYNSNRIKKIIINDENAKNTVLYSLTSSTTRNKIKTSLDILNFKNWDEVRTLAEGGGRGVGGPID